MYYGVNRTVPDCDNYNFYASQLRIRVEMSFGMMQMKWGILWKPLKVSLTNVKHIITSISRLHNFCINERILNDSFNEEKLVGVGEDRCYLPSQMEDANGDSLGFDSIYINNTHPEYRGVSFLRENMALRVKTLNLVRPFKNKIVKEIDKTLL